MDDGKPFFTDCLHFLYDFKAAESGDPDAGAGFQNEVKSGIAIVKKRSGVFSVGAGRGGPSRP